MGAQCVAVVAVCGALLRCDPAVGVHRVTQFSTSELLGANPATSAPISYM